MHNAARYQSALKKALRCTGSCKKQLVQQFQTTLDDFLDEHPSPSTEELVAAFGPPDEMANVLMERVSKEDRQKYLRIQNRKRILVAILAVLFIAYVTYALFWKQRPIISKTEIIIDTAITTEVDN